MNQKDSFGLGGGYVAGSSYDATCAATLGNVVTNLTVQTIIGENTAMATAMPYGFMSLPAANSYAVTLNMMGSTRGPIMMATVPANDNWYTTSNLVSGESAHYTQMASIQAKLNGLYGFLDNTNGQLSSPMLIGKNVVKVLIDIISQLNEWYSSQFTSIVASLNSHSHQIQNVQSGGDTITTQSMASSGTNITAPEINSNLTQDMSQLEAGNAYLTDTGKDMT